MDLVRAAANPAVLKESTHSSDSNRTRASELMLMHQSRSLPTNTEPRVRIRIARILSSGKIATTDERPNEIFLSSVEQS